MKQRLYSKTPVKSLPWNRKYSNKIYSDYLRGNFKTGKVGRNCQKCKIGEENQQHLLDCRALSDSSLVVRYQDLIRAEPSTIGNILKFKFKLLQSVMPGVLWTINFSRSERKIFLLLTTWMLRNRRKNFPWCKSSTSWNEDYWSFSLLFLHPRNQLLDCLPESLFDQAQYELRVEVVLSLENSVRRGSLNWRGGENWGKWKAMETENVVARSLDIIIIPATRLATWLSELRGEPGWYR